MDRAMADLAVNDSPKDQLTPFGKPMLKHWLFDPAYKNLNHGSFGAHPAAVGAAQRKFLDIADANPDIYVRQQHVVYLDAAREATAKILNAPTDECVFVKNATTGVATVLHNLAFKSNEAVVYFDPVYGAVERGIISLNERNGVQGRKVAFQFPIAEDELVRRFHEVVRHAREVEKLTVRAAVFDTVVSNPGVRFPFERFTAICREEGILSVIDGAHGIGNIHLDLSKLQPDFFTSNCHKWLYTPRSAAVLYVPKRNQHFVRTTLPTSWGFIPAPTSAATKGSVLKDPQVPTAKTPFEELFEFVATSDDSAYLCVPAALKFREEVCGGEDAIISYCERLANDAADAVSAALGTDVLQEPDLKPGEISNMRRCTMTTVRLPLAIDIPSGEEKIQQPEPLATFSAEDALLVEAWIKRTLMDQYKTFVPPFAHGPWLWVRLSAQVYLEKSDFEWLGGVLRDVCERAAKGEYRGN